MRLIDIKRHIQIASDNFKPALSNSGNYYFIDNLNQTKKVYKLYLILEYWT